MRILRRFRRCHRYPRSGTLSRKIVGQILALEQGIVASMGNVADDLEARAKKSGMLRR